MIAILAALCLAAAPDGGRATPDALWSIAYLDLHDRTPAADRPYTRYLSVAGMDPQAYRSIVTFAANSTSWRSEFARPAIVGGGLLLKLDLRWFGWDYPYRAYRLRELERRGVVFAFQDANERRLFLDPWERLAELDPFFVVGYYDAHGQYVRGWLDPATVNASRKLSRSCKFLLRADWIVGRLLQERQFGGIYSDLLMFPPKEADFYKSLLIDIKAINRDGTLRQGGAVLESVVALHNRGLELIPSPYPAYNGFLWQTYDFNVDARGDKSVLEALAGTLNHDGRESIGSLPNRLLFYRLFDGEGNPADVVPEDIAQIKIPQTPVRETRVINAYACLKCHESGIYPFEDVVRKAFTSQSTLLKAGYGKANRPADIAAAIEDYYNSSLGRTIAAQNEVYTARVRECVGIDGPTISKMTVDAIEIYTHELVTPDAAAREMGYPLDLARLYWLAASDPALAAETARQLGILKLHYCVPDHGNPQLAVLASGQPIRRAAWEQSFADAMRVVSYSWEHRKP